jgi:3-keto-disaccharide hydrolase
MLEHMHLQRTMSNSMKQSNFDDSMIVSPLKLAIVVTTLLVVHAASAQQPPAGFTPLFNGKDLAGWRGGDTFDHRAWLALPEAERTAKNTEWTADMKKHWSAQNGELVNDGNGKYATTEKDYGDFELLLEYKTVAKADSGIYLRGVPQVQIWDSTETAKFPIGAGKGSGGLWNNNAGAPGKDPLVLADKPFGEWNKFRIVMVGSRVSVWLNDKQVVDHAILENYYDKADKALKPEQRRPVPAKGPIQLQTHGGEIRWRNVFVREIPAGEANAILQKRDDGGFESVFNGKDFTGWGGPTDEYEINDGALACKAGQGGTIYTRKVYSDFVARLEFKLPPGGNNGLAIRYPGSGDAAYVGMCEVQVLDDTADKYGKLDSRQYHGSAYGMVASHRGYLRPVGEWNSQEVTVKGPTIKVELNGATILDADLSDVTDFMGNHPHPGKDRSSGHFGLAGHTDPVQFRNIRVKKLP